MKKLKILCTIIAFFVFTSCSTEIFTLKIDQNFKNYPHENLVSKKIQDLHKELFIVDMHADSLLWNRNLLENVGRGHVDVPRLIEGNVAIQTFAAVTKFPFGCFDLMTLNNIADMNPPCTWFSMKQRALYQAKKLHYFAKNSQSKLRIIKSKKDLKKYMDFRKKNKNITAGILSIEGLHALEYEAENVDIFAKNGFRIMGLTHLFDNELGGSSYGTKRGGLTAYGKKVLLKMKENHLIIDLAHASPLLIDTVTKFYNDNSFTTPIIASHTGAIGAFPNERNLSDKHLVAIAKTGGVICIGYFPPAIEYSHPEQIASSIIYVIDTLNKFGFSGIEHVGLGSDFDGGVTVPFDTSRLVLITEALSSAKYKLTQKDIYKIMGGNMVQLLMKGLPE